MVYLEVQSIFESVRMGSVSKISVEQIQEILREKVERTLLHSQHIVTDTNTFIDSEVQKKIKEIDEEEDLLKSQIERNYEQVLEHIEKEVQGVLKRKELSIDEKSLEFKQLRKQFLELRLIRNTWKKELLNESGKNIEDIRKEIFQKFSIKDEPQSTQEIQTTPTIKETVKTTSVEKDGSPKFSEVNDEFIRE